MSGLSIRRDIAVRYRLLGVVAVLCVATILLLYSLAVGSQDAQAAPVKPDKVSPVIEHLTLGKTPTHEDSLTVRGTVTDEHLKDYNLRIYDHDKKLYSPWIGMTGTEQVAEGELGALDIAALPDGEYFVRVWADDMSKNRTGGWPQIYMPFTVDRTTALAINPIGSVGAESAISGSLLWSAGGGVAGEVVTLKMMQGETLVGVVDATTDADGAWSVSPPVVANGDYTLVATGRGQEVRLDVTFAQTVLPPEEPPIVAREVPNYLESMSAGSVQISEQPILQPSRDAASLRIRTLMPRDANAAVGDKEGVVATANEPTSLDGVGVLPGVDVSGLTTSAAERSWVAILMESWWMAPVVVALALLGWRIKNMFRDVFETPTSEAPGLAELSLFSD